MENKINEESVRSFIEKCVNESGLPLEEKTYSNIRKYFRSIRRNAHYLDKDELKDRDIDFLAENGCFFIPPKNKNDRAFVIDMEIIVECKKGPNHAWIFSGEEIDRISLFEKMFKTINHPDLLMPEFLSSEPLPENTDIQQIIPPLTTKLFTADGYDEVIFSDGDKKKKHDGKDEPAKFLRKSILQVTKASRHRQDFVKENFKKWTHDKKDKSYPIWITIFQPVIVFEGLMYKTLPSEGSLKIEPIQFARIEKEYLSAAHREMEGEIHIVSINWLPQYLEMIKNNYKIMDNHEEFWKFFGTKENRKGFL